MRLLLGLASRDALRSLNPRIPCGMRRQEIRFRGADKPFQSTHPIRDATIIAHGRVDRNLVSIHASHTGCDSLAGFADGHTRRFNPRIPYGMRQLDGLVLLEHTLVSIHASHTGCDATRPGEGDQLARFNPRNPYGMRRGRPTLLMQISKFQSTHPIRDATDVPIRLITPHLVSIHASHTGCDLTVSVIAVATAGFNPRIPYGMRLVWALQRLSATAFQSTHPIRDATLLTSLHYAGCVIVSIHASHTGCDLTHTLTSPLFGVFQSTHPIWDATARGAYLISGAKVSIHASHTGCDLELSEKRG